MKFFITLAALTLAVANGAPQSNQYGAPESRSFEGAASSQSVRTVAREEPIAIVRSSYNAPGTAGFERAYDYSFESENGIKQEATGELRTIDDVDVMVMRGSYEYIGADGLTYVVDWYADETGFHPSAAHLPQSVELEGEHAELIEAQVRFAAEEDAAKERQAAASVPVASIRQAPSNNYNAPAARSESSNSFSAPEVRAEASAPQNTYIVVEETAAPVNSYGAPEVRAEASAPVAAVEPQNTYIVVEETPAPVQDIPQARYVNSGRQGRRGRGFFRRINTNA